MLPFSERDPAILASSASFMARSTPLPGPLRASIRVPSSPDLAPFLRRSRLWTTASKTASQGSAGVAGWTAQRKGHPA